MTTARDTIVDALDLESFVLCASESRGARPPRAQFFAPSRKTPDARKVFKRPCQPRAQVQNARARSATPGAGVLPKHLLSENFLTQPKFIL